MRNLSSSEFRTITGTKSASARPKKSKKLPAIDTAPFIEATRRARLTAGDGWTRIVLPYPPSVNSLYATVTVKYGPRAGRQIRTLSAEGKRFHKAVEDICLACGVRPIVGRTWFVMHTYRPQKSGDCSNYVKSLEDALKGFAWIDDSQTKGFAVIQHEDPSFPRVEFKVRLAAGETMNFAEFLK